MHAEEWIAKYGRYRRTISAYRLRRALFRKRGECTWCGVAVPKGRRAWCSEQCVNQFLARVPSSVGRQVEKRDKGVCSICGRDTKRMKHLFNQLRDIWRGRLRVEAGVGRYRRLEPVPAALETLKELLRHWQALGFNVSIGSNWAGTAHLWEADHVLPVSEGGGLCGLDGFRTACIPCHKQETAALAKRAAEKRKSKT